MLADADTYQGLAILGLEFRDRDHYYLIVSLVVEAESFLPVVSKSRLRLSSVSILRPIPRLYIPQSQYQDRDFCFSLNNDTEIKTLHLFNLHLKISYV